MRQTIRIVLLDSDAEFLREAEHYLSGKAGIRVAGALRDGLAGLRLIRREMPDVVVTGLVLPGMDGCSLLGELRRLTKPPVCIVCTAFHTEASLKIACKYGAAYYMCRPVDLQCLSRAIVDCFQVASAKEAQVEPSSERTGPSLAEVRRLLSGYGIAPRSAGCRYLSEAILLLQSRPARIDNLTQNIYAQIAENNHVSVAGVERCIRVAIGSAYAADAAAFPLPCCPTNKQFIQYVTGKLAETD